MRKINRYKLFSKLKYVHYKRYPLRIIKFHRTKWLGCKKKIIKQLKFQRRYKITKRGKKKIYTIIRGKKNYPIFNKFNKINNPRLSRVNRRRVTRLKRSFATKLQHRKFMSSFFDNKLKFEPVEARKFQTKKEYFLYFFVKPYYRVDILLWSLGVFSGTDEAIMNINLKNILINNKPISKKTHVIKGDVISFSKCTNTAFLTCAERINKYSDFWKHFPFIEIDFYSKTCVIIKDLNDLTDSDIFWLVDFRLNQCQL